MGGLHFFRYNLFLDTNPNLPRLLACFLVWIGVFGCSVAPYVLMLSGSVVAGTLLFCLSVGVAEGEPQEMPSLRGAVAPSWCTSTRDVELFSLLTSKTSQLEKAEFSCINGGVKRTPRSRGSAPCVRAAGPSSYRAASAAGRRTGRLCVWV